MAQPAPAPVLVDEPDPRILVVYENFAVGAAAFQRLADDYGVVELARLPGALRRLSEAGRYEVVVLCPYLSETARESVRDRCATDAGAPAIIEVRDSPDGPTATTSLPAFGPMAATLAAQYQECGLTPKKTPRGQR